MALYDVLIVGGGAAGIAAGRRLAQTHLSFRIVEAGDRLGGRAFTRRLAGHPFDLGCGWLHSADRNPWRELAEAAGAEIDRTPPAWSRQWEDIGFAAADQKAAWAAFETLGRRLREDPPASDRAADALDSTSKWNGYLEALSGYINGAELDCLSVADYLAYEDADTGENWRLPSGYGAFIVDAAEGLPVTLDAPVTKIDRSGPELALHLSNAVLTARAVIVTVSTDVLSTERLRFDPPLTDKAEAAAALPLGLANKAFLALDRPEPFEPDTQLLGDPRDPATGSYYLRPFGRAVVECYFGGAGARAIEAEGAGAALDFALEQLVALLGSGMRRRLTPLAESRWGADPLFGGAYSHALPGQASARARLAAPVEDRIFFAGEACHAGDFSTAHGAYETGVAAADVVVAALRG